MPRESFIPNDVTLTPEQHVMIVTGPNMAGKSTVLRQVGLIVLMAQAGSFVPARAATIGVVDRLFTRVGASDDLTLADQNMDAANFSGDQNGDDVSAEAASDDRNIWFALKTPTSSASQAEQTIVVTITAVDAGTF